jgi:hypothetical protein
MLYYIKTATGIEVHQNSVLPVDGIVITAAEYDALASGKSVVINGTIIAADTFFSIH